MFREGKVENHVGASDSSKELLLKSLRKQLAKWAFLLWPRKLYIQDSIDLDDRKFLTLEVRNSFQINLVLGLLAYCLACPYKIYKSIKKDLFSSIIQWHNMYLFLIKPCQI